MRKLESQQKRIIAAFLLLADALPLILNVLVQLPVSVLEFCPEAVEGTN